MSPIVAGYFSAIAGAVVAGSWQAMIKHESVEKHQLHPAMVLSTFLLGFFLASWIACLVEYEEAYSFTAWGIISGALFVASMALNIAVSFPLLGIAVGSGIASSVAVLTALVWSADIFDESMRSAALTDVGVVVVVIGLNILIFAGRSLHTDGKADGADKPASRESAHLLPATTPVPAEPSDSAFIRGVAGAIFAGLFGGSYLYPSEETDKGTLFVPSMGIGCLIAAPVFGVLLILAKPPTDTHPLIPPPAVFRSAAPWMLAGGAVNVLAIILILKAVDDINYVVANTIAQTSIFVTGLWSWLFFSELKGRLQISTFFVGATILVLGACIVSYYGTTE